MEQPSRLTIENSKKALADSKVTLDGIDCVLKDDGTKVVVTRSGEISLFDDHGIVRGRYPVPYGSELKVSNEEQVTEGQVLFEWDPYNSVIVSYAKGKIEFEDLVGVTFRVESDDLTGFKQKVIIDSRSRKQSPTIIINGNKKDGERSYSIPVGAHVSLDDNKKIKKGQILCKIPRTIGSSGDITGGLPRVTQLFEARNPSNPAVVSEIDGIVSFGPKIKRGKQRVFVFDELELRQLDELGNRSDFGEIPDSLKVTRSGVIWMLNNNADAVAEATANSDDTEELKPKKRVTKSKATVKEPRTCDFVFKDSGTELIPRGKHMAVHDGDRVKAGEKLCEGSVNPHDILRVSGVEALHEYIVNEIQSVYRLQGVTISDKHIECIVRQMMRKVVITEGGDTELLEHEEISRAQLRKENEAIQETSGRAAKYRPLLLGITKSSLGTDSFISAASFQETTKILTRAAVEGKHDALVGLKENVIMGRLIPSGTGSPAYRNMTVKDLDAETSLVDTNEEDELLEPVLDF